MTQQDVVQKSGPPQTVDMDESVENAGVKVLHPANTATPLEKSLHSKSAVHPSTQDSGTVKLPGPGEAEFGSTIQADLDRQKAIRKELSAVAKAMEDKKNAA